MQRWLWKNTDFLPKKDYISTPERKKKKKKTGTCWHFNANMNSVFKLEIMHQNI